MPGEKKRFNRERAGDADHLPQRTSASVVVTERMPRSWTDGVAGFESSSPRMARQVRGRPKAADPSHTGSSHLIRKNHHVGPLRPDRSMAGIGATHLP